MEKTMLERIEVDTHTHTVLSGHAWSTLRENAHAGHGRGLQGLCLTEHGYALPGAGPHYLTSVQKMLPPELEGLTMFYGVEANIMGLEGQIDIADPMLFGSAWNIASMHPECMESGSEDENTHSYKIVLAHPAVDMLGHIDDIRFPCRFEEVIGEAGRLGKVIEINNNSLHNRRGSIPRVEEIARLCARLGVRVAISSDAHFDTMVGVVDSALALLAKADFPEELVVNRTLAAFQEYQAGRQTRIAAGKEEFLKRA